MQATAICRAAVLCCAIFCVLPARGQDTSPPASAAERRLATQQRRNQLREKDYKERLEELRKSAQPFSVEIQSEIATVLRRLVSIYRQTNRMQEAENALGELLTLYQELARFQPEMYQTEVSSTLMNLGGIYRDTGRREDAIRSYEEALRMLRELVGGRSVEEGAEELSSDLALALSNLANIYRYTGRMGEAERGYQEAIAIRRKLAATKPELYQMELGISLNSLGNLYGETNRMLDAERAYSESISIRQEIIKSGQGYGLNEPKAGLALTLTNLAGIYIDTGREEEAGQALTQALDTYREVMKSDLDEYIQRDFAWTLDRFVEFLFLTRQFDRAVEPSWELVSLWRELQQKYPPKYREEYLGSLGRSASLLSISGRRAEMEQMVSEALAIGRQMWQEDPKKHAATYSGILITSALVAEDPSEPSACRNLLEASEIAPFRDAHEFLRERLEQCREISTKE